MNILITGASRGIGRALACKMAENMHGRLFLLSRNYEQLLSLKREIESGNPGVEVIPLAIDLQVNGMEQTVIKEISLHCTSLDILVNNAGYVAVSDFADAGPEEIQRQWRINYLAPALLIRTLLPLLEKAEKGHVVNISSMAGFQSAVKFRGLSHYSATKAALVALTECLATEYSSQLSFNAICPGSVQTEMLEEAFPGLKAEIQPEQMAEFISHFAFNAHKYMNGKVIPVALSNP